MEPTSRTVGKATGRTLTRPRLRRDDSGPVSKITPCETEHIGVLRQRIMMPHPVAPRPEPLAPRPFRGIVVLVVEEDLSALAITQQMLERLGALVRTAHNAQAGLRAAVIHRPHLILIDLDLPNVDGLNLARLLRQDAQLGRTRLVALTSRSLEHPATMRGWSVEFDAKISKPVTEPALVALARHVPGGRALPGE